MSLKQIQMCSQGEVVEERRFFTKDVHLITFIICQSVMAKLDLLSIAAGKHTYLTNIQSGKTNNCASILSKFVTEIDMHSF